MQEIYSHKNSNDFGDQIDLLEVFYVLLNGKRIIFSVTAFVSIIAVIYSLMLPNIYESKALLAPVNPSNNIAGTMRGFTNISSLPGLNLPPSSNESNTQKAIKKISSLSFFENNILPNIYLPDLMAVEAWNPKTNTLIYDKNDYDVKSSTWVRKYSYPQQQIPSPQESYKVFISQHLSLSEDNKLGFITLKIKHQSSFIAKQWTELIVNEVNNFFRLKDKLESEKAASYLNQEISLTDLSEIKQVLAQLLQEEIKKLTLIEANQYYVFEYIDPPAIMEVKSKPSRALICILGTLLGAMLSILIVLVRHYVYTKKT